MCGYFFLIMFHRVAKGGLELQRKTDLKEGGGIEGCNKQNRTKKIFLGTLVAI